MAKTALATSSGLEELLFWSSAMAERSLSVSTLTCLLAPSGAFVLRLFLCFGFMKDPMAGLVVKWAIIPGFAVPFFQVARFALVAREGWGIPAALILLFLVVLVFVVLVGLLLQRLQLLVHHCNELLFCRQVRRFPRCVVLEFIELCSLLAHQFCGLEACCGCCVFQVVDVMQPVRRIFDLFIHPED